MWIVAVVVTSYRSSWSCEDARAGGGRIERRRSFVPGGIVAALVGGEEQAGAAGLPTAAAADLGEELELEAEQVTAPPTAGSSLPARRGRRRSRRRGAMRGWLAAEILGVMFEIRVVLSFLMRVDGSDRHHQCSLC